MRFLCILEGEVGQNGIDTQRLCKLLCEVCFGLLFSPVLHQLKFLLERLLAILVEVVAIEVQRASLVRGNESVRHVLLVNLIPEQQPKQKHDRATLIVSPWQNTHQHQKTGRKPRAYQVENPRAFCSERSRTLRPIQCTWFPQGQRPR
jgi:hypothetical protein